MSTESVNRRSEWATANQLSPYVSKKESNTTPPTEQHRLAWETADFIKDAGLGLEYWQDVVNNRPKNDASQDSSLGGNSNYELRGLRCGIDEEDEQLQEVLRISREACYRDSAALLTPSSSPPQRSRQSSISRNIITIDDDSDEESMNSTSLRGGLCFSPKRVRPSRRNHDTEIALSTNQKRTRDKRFEQALDAQQKKHKPSFSGLDQLLCRSSLSQRSSAPMSDAIEGDMYV
jgi:5-methylcytosine-specific restriction endonuclease McrA